MKPHLTAAIESKMDSRIEIFERKIPSRIGLVGESRNSTFRRMTAIATEDPVFDLVQGEDQPTNVIRKPEKFYEIPVTSSIF
jgi:hypothetical protein